jgi:phosphatidylserine/phosphatidylglycerophosphate/cardiolipin synthase-like enzyme
MSNRIPIYRHYAENNRFYYDQLLKNDHDWSSPGVVAFYAYGQPEPGTIPIYWHRWKPMGNGDPDRYFYDQQIQNNSNWTEGQLAFYAHKSAVAETVPIYQYVGERTYYYFTTDSQVPGWANERIAFYAYPPDFLGIADEIERTLARKKPDKNKGVTYLRTSGNKFSRLDTPGLWGPDATKKAPESLACKKLLDSITEVIGGATERLDLTFLYLPDPDANVSAFPDGDFQKHISEGFDKLITSGRKSDRWPSIRILFGVPLGGFWRKIYGQKVPPGVSLMEDERRWLEKTIELTKTYKMADMKCPIQVAWGKSGSWNHTKIIVADDKKAITGGHNCWDDDYLGTPPTHDVSGVFEGPAAGAARLFCDKLWEHTDRIYSFSLINGVFQKGTKAEPPKPILNTGTPGGLEMLSLGRLGKGLANFSISSNASVTARIVALCKAKNTIRISQQSLRAIIFTVLGVPLTQPLYDFYTCLAIVRAVRAGVNVEIVLSGQFGKGYGGEAQKVLEFLQLLYLLDVLPPDNIPTFNRPARPGQPPPKDPGTKRFNRNRVYSERCHAVPPRENIDKWVDLAAGVATLAEGKDPIVDENLFDLDFRSDYKGGDIAEFNKKLKLATLYYAGNSQSSNHAKMYIIDEDCFYVGSDNMYPSRDNEGLQEFGYLIEDKNETKKFNAEYWDKLWEYSQKHLVR